MAETKLNMTYKTLKIGPQANLSEETKSSSVYISSNNNIEQILKTEVDPKVFCMMFYAFYAVQINTFDVWWRFSA